jgi:hypothetical protein
MSTFTTELDGKMLPDVIAEIVEAWYDNQQIDNKIENKIVNNENGAYTLDLMKKYKMSKPTICRLLRGLNIKASALFKDGHRYSYLDNEKLQKLSPYLDAWLKGMSVNEIIDMLPKSS